MSGSNGKEEGEGPGVGAEEGAEDVACAGRHCRGAVRDGGRGAAMARLTGTRCVAVLSREDLYAAESRIKTYATDLHHAVLVALPTLHVTPNLSLSVVAPTGLCTYEQPKHAQKCLLSDPLYVFPALLHSAVAMIVITAVSTKVRPHTWATQTTWGLELEPEGLGFKLTRAKPPCLRLELHRDSIAHTPTG